jgi:hypothetical protein
MVVVTHVKQLKAQVNRSFHNFAITLPLQRETINH